MQEYTIDDILISRNQGINTTTEKVKYSDSGYKIVQAKNVEKYKYSFDEKNYIDEDTFNRIKELHKLKNGDLLFSNIGSQMGNACIFDSDEACVITWNVLKLNPNPEIVNTSYLCLWFNWKSNEIRALNGSSTMPFVSGKVIGGLKINLPDLETQNSIAKIMDSINEKIKVNTAINRNLSEQGRTLFEVLTSGKEVNAKLGDLICNIETGSRPKGGAQTEGVPSIGAEKIEAFGVYDYSGEKYVDEEFFEKLKKGHVLSGDVLLYKDGAYTGKSSMALDGFPHERCAINEHVFKLNTEENKYQFFLYFTLDNKQIRDYIFTLASSKAAQPGLNQTELLGIEIVLPNIEELDSFEKQVSEMMHMIASNAKENKRLAELRDSLLPKLMSGELDVSSLEI